MKKTSLTYKVLEFSKCQAYYDIRYCGQTTACNIVQGCIKALFALVGWTGVFLILAFALCVITYSAGAVLAYLSLPLLEMFGVVDWFSIDYYNGGASLTFIGLFIVLAAGIIECLKGNMKVVPSYLKPNTPKDVVKKEPHWITLWVKGLKDKVCYIVKVEE